MEARDKRDDSDVEMTSKDKPELTFAQKLALMCSTYLDLQDADSV
jgi:hypothetical protein